VKVGAKMGGRSSNWPECEQREKKGLLFSGIGGLKTEDMPTEEGGEKSRRESGIDQ